MFGILFVVVRDRRGCYSPTGRGVGAFAAAGTEATEGRRHLPADRQLSHSRVHTQVRAPEWEKGSARDRDRSAQLPQYVASLMGNEAEHRAKCSRPRTGARMEQLSLGVVGTSRKPDERRLPIHPAHLGRIDADLRRRIFLERGYGQRFGVSDERARAGGRRPALARAARRGVRRGPAAQAAGGGPRGAAPRAGPVGMAALRPGRGASPRSRSTAA